ncbi:TPA: fimbrial protein [Escherichia coli]|nr:fimbrial protein [Escherichia coli]
MKKSLIALAVVVSAVSGVAHADFQDVFSIDGTITADTYESKWEWSIGKSLAFQNTTKDMTDDNKKLIITQNHQALILKGNTKEAFSVTSTGSGAVPVISFMDYKGDVVELNNSGGEAGKGYFSLPMKDSANSDLGSVKVNVSYAGVAVRSGSQYAHVFSVEPKNNSHIYYGGVAAPALGRGNNASTVVSTFGGKLYNDLIAQVQKAKPGSSGQPQENWKGAFDMVSSDQVIASSYVLGIAQGQTIEASFNSPVLKTTAWSAPLSVLVTYN